jgi:protein gp37
MADETAIQWTDHTFNTWWGCARVSPACRFCYADGLARRYGHELWRRSGPRRMLSDTNWKKPLKWNRDAERAGKPALVFCCSMADVFERHPVDEINAQLDSARARLWDLIDETPWLRWQLLTKRIENVASMAPWGEQWPSNVWLGTSVEDQRRADERIPTLLMLPAAVRFLSCEPLLGPVDLTKVAYTDGGGTHLDVVHGRHGAPGLWAAPAQRVSWVIAGGESGPKHRPMNLDWARSLRDQCAAAGVPFLFKQVGGRTSKAGGRELDGRTHDEFPERAA